MFIVVQGLWRTLFKGTYCDIYVSHIDSSSCQDLQHSDNLTRTAFYLHGFHPKENYHYNDSWLSIGTCLAVTYALVQANNCSTEMIEDDALIPSMQYSPQATVAKMTANGCSVCSWIDNCLTKWSCAIVLHCQSGTEKGRAADGHFVEMPSAKLLQIHTLLSRTRLSLMTAVWHYPLRLLMTTAKVKWQIKNGSQILIRPNLDLLAEIRESALSSMYSIPHCFQSLKSWWSVSIHSVSSRWAKIH